MSNRAMIEGLETRRMFDSGGCLNLTDFTLIALHPEYDGCGGWEAIGASNSPEGYTDFAAICEHPERFTNGALIADSAGPGDTNCDGQIDKYDFRQFSANFNKSSNYDWRMGDYTLNGTVTLRDFALAAKNVANL